MQRTNSLFGGPILVRDRNFVSEIFKVPDEAFILLQNIPEWTADSAENIPLSNLQESVNPVLSLDKKFISSHCKFKASDAFHTATRKNTRDFSRTTDDYQVLSQQVRSFCMKDSAHSSGEEHLPKRTLKRAWSLPNIRHLEPINFPTAFGSQESLKIVAREVSDSVEMPLVEKSSPAKKSDVVSSEKAKITRLFEKLDDKIVNHKFLKEMNVLSKSSKNRSPLLSRNPPVESSLDHFGKRLKLLEKRFSPSKIPSVQSAKSTEVNAQKLSTVASVQESPKSAAVEQAEVQKSSTKDGGKILHEVTSDNLAKEGDKFDSVLKSGVALGESFLSQPIPCGQPPPGTDQWPSKLPNSPSNSPVDKSSRNETLSSSPVDEFNRNETPSSYPVDKSSRNETPSSSPVEEFNRNETPSSSPVDESNRMKSPIASPVQEFTKINSPIQRQESSNVKSPSAAEVVEQPPTRSGQTSASNVVQTQVSGKRKRRSKNEKSSKKLQDEKKPEEISISFTADQVRSMIDLLKIFESSI